MVGMDCHMVGMNCHMVGIDGHMFGPLKLDKERQRTNSDFVVGNNEIKSLLLAVIAISI